MARYSARDMVAGTRKGGSNPAPTPIPSAKKTSVKIPQGGHAEVRSVDNGVVVSVRDSSYRTVSETVAVDATQVNFEKK